MQVEQPVQVQEKQSRECEDRKGSYPHIFEGGQDSAVHVLVVAALTAFIVYVLSEGVNFSDSTTLALNVFFAMSIAGAVLGRSKQSAAKPESKPEVVTQPEITVETHAAVECAPCAPEPQGQM